MASAASGDVDEAGTACISIAKVFITLDSRRVGLRLFQLGAAMLAIACPLALAQTTAAKPASAAATKPKSKTAKTSLAVWSPDVQQALGVSATDFKTAGLNKLTQAQLDALMTAAKNHPYADPAKKVLSCAVISSAPGTRVKVLLTVSGDDPTGQRATEIRQAVQSLSGVDTVSSPAGADRALHVVIQEQTLGKRTIGYTASYMTGAPCVDESGGKRADVELKGELGTYTEPKGPDLARDLAGMLDKDLQAARAKQGTPPPP
jgi:hypothetical protein